MFVKDRSHRWVWVNDAFCRLVAVPREELLGKTDHDFFHLKDREVLTSGQTVIIEEEPITDAERRTHTLSTTKSPLRGPDGEVTHLVGIIHDISKLKAAEEVLRVTNEELERRVEDRTRALREAQYAILRKERLVVLGQLSGGLAHQIRNPLSAISNATSVLRRKLADLEDADARQALSIISEEVWEANRIITDLLDFARVRPPSCALVTVTRLVADALAAARPEGNVVVSVHVPEHLEVWADERQTRDAIGNVIRNALEAMDEGGKLTIRASSAPPFARISVEDTGPGLPRESLVHLFEPLVTSKALGLGLGLPTAKALIENQGGDIRYVAADGEGARFEILLPLTEPGGI
jgi:PAS domain S-box-containing protein